MYIKSCALKRNEVCLMPLIEMREVFTPLKLIGIKFFRSSEGQVYMKVWNHPRKRLFE